MTKPAYVLNGPNLNLLGEREPEIYGTTTLADIEAACLALGKEIGLPVVFRQTNHEGVMVDLLQEARREAAAVILNPAGFSFRSIPVLDATKMLACPFIELHISNIHGRDELHRHSIISGGATAVICGLGAAGYPLALVAAARLLGLAPAALPAPLRAGP